MNYKEFFGSSGYARLLKILGMLLVLMVIFSIGMAAGYYRAKFSFERDNNYYSIGWPRSPLAPFLNDTDDSNPHGAIGKIISVQLPSIMIRDQGNVERIAVIGGSTAIRHFRSEASTTDLIPGEQVIVIGEPDGKGRINAAFIRILPQPLASSTMPSSKITR
ncbi:hypothetical protein KGQ27_02165 [Patescibacteria group bacterium]|nr:hypothetical protein [Patescibacteria group bacterium]MDE1946277.1 hypothetical protein [Patescibacteria group bacterium]MDE2010729.1 hypothetical protein [Patescibacteria group bacterium]MDE2232613.1 hypothetical protein [Patescibacteria group bacterium]